jgi:hypothetical protein
MIITMMLSGYFGLLEPLSAPNIFGEDRVVWLDLLMAAKIA